MQPQAAHAAVSRSLQFEWSFLQRVISYCATAFVPLRDAITISFILLYWVALFLRLRCSYLTYLLVLVGWEYQESASVAFSSSLRSSAVLRAAISGQAEFSPTVHVDVLVVRPLLLEESISSPLYRPC